MKRTLLTVTIVLFAVSSAFAAQNDIDVTRTQLWGNLIFKGKVTKSGLGIFARYSSRYNVDFEKEKNGTVIDDETQASWLNELFIGPSYATKITPKLKLVTSPQYRVMGFYLDEKKKDSTPADPEAYYEHTLHWPTTLAYNFGFLTAKYRLILWNRFPYEYTQNGVEDETDNEFLTRHYAGVDIPLHKMLSFYLAEEVFILHTAGDEGENTYWRNAVWTGFDIKPSKSFKFTLGYTNYYTFKEDSDVNEITVNDHYIYTAITYSTDFTK